MWTMRIPTILTSSMNGRFEACCVRLSVSTPCRCPRATLVALLSTFANRKPAAPASMRRFFAVFLPIADGIKETNCVLNYLSKIGGFLNGVCGWRAMKVGKSRFKVSDVFQYLTFTLPIRLYMLKLWSNTTKTFSLRLCMPMNYPASVMQKK